MRTVFVGLACLLMLWDITRAVAQERETPTLITFDEAIAHHKQGNFGLARAEYLELAKVGIWGAYVNLGAMALNGNGAPADPGQALGWFKSAEELGQKVPDDWVNKLERALTSSQHEMAANIVAEFGKEATLRRLIDAAHPCGSATTSEAQTQSDPQHIIGPKLLNTVRLAYPEPARQSGRQGALAINILVDVDGRAKDPRIEFIVPVADDPGFAKAALEATLSMRLEPGSLNGKPIPIRVQRTYHFGMASNPGPAPNIWNKAPLEKLRAAAYAGSATAQHAVAYLALLDDKAAKIMQVGCDDITRMDITSALGGIDEAQLGLSFRVRYKHDTSSLQMSDAWLRQSATAYPRAQLLLAMQLLEHADAAQHAAEISELLIKAAAGRDDYVRKRAAFLLSTSSLMEVRNPRLALELAQNLKSEITVNPELEVVLAAAHAASGNYPDAIRAQKIAIEKAIKLSWDTAPLQDMLSAYQANRVPDVRGFYLSWSDDKQSYRGSFEP